ncbi:hypothetical protein AJ80_02023 [Polytolypa hystricis UAMH7299]|uniref:Uncharacterized protein n=1 Tax=Polytolypa hystricis (strain UAMH7299) TaxID=1447883 RepID=A0A2B7YSD7_POLH7|nr:hypothetical protein AJ80_02023 [Polytolypa hystricis UAMH7299]
MVSHSWQGRTAQDIGMEYGHNQNVHRGARHDDPVSGSSRNQYNDAHELYTGTKEARRNSGSSVSTVDLFNAMATSEASHRQMEPQSTKSESTKTRKKLLPPLALFFIALIPLLIIPAICIPMALGAFGKKGKDNTNASAPSHVEISISTTSTTAVVASSSSSMLSVRVLSVATGLPLSASHPPSSTDAVPSPTTKAQNSTVATPGSGSDPTTLLTVVRSTSSSTPSPAIASLAPKLPHDVLLLPSIGIVAPPSTYALPEGAPED